MEFVDIPYISESRADSLRHLDVVTPEQVSSTSSPLLVFIHGGAWRSEDKRDHTILARCLAKATRYPVAALNYRLTQAQPLNNDIRHPAHAEDVLDALRFLTTWPGPPHVGPLYDPNRLYLLGHSCSAHILASIFLDSSSVSPSLAPPPHILQAVKGIVMSEGIYDIDLLLQSFPTYLDWFIRDAFGHCASYAAFSTTTFPLISAHIKWLIIHSKGDTLVDMQQSETMYLHLCRLYGSNASTRVFRVMDKFDQEHNDILRGQLYVDIVTDFINKN
ncbi:hypothetical protein C0991_004222 [Blastosporella zonata]|nr:hypothetical protein C0991_004222 [Blastosporella zonata]